MTFNNEKSQYLTVTTKRKPKELELKVKRGKIEKCEKYKYLGEYVNTKGNYADAINNKRSKVGGIVLRIKRLAHTTGQLHNKVAMKLINSMLLPVITYGTETWTRISRSEIDAMERVQKDALYNIFDMKRSTPYEGFLSEIGIPPIEVQIEIKKLSLYHELMNSKNNRIARRILMEQKMNDKDNSWWSEVSEILTKLKVETINVEQISKGEWKKILKRKISEQLDERIATSEKTKVRFLKNWKEKEYITKLRKKEANLIMEARLNMIEIGDNYKGRKMDRDCKACGKYLNTEHIIECGENDKSRKHNMGDENLSVIKYFYSKIKNYIDNLKLQNDIT